MYITMYIVQFIQKGLRRFYEKKTHSSKTNQMNHHWPFLWLFNGAFLAQLSHHSLLD